MKSNSPQNLLIGKLKLLLCTLVANALIAKRSCHYGAVHEDSQTYFLSYSKNFLAQRSNCTIKVCLVLYESFVSNCLIDFFATGLLTTRTYTHAHCCSLLKLGAKLDLVIDRFT